MYALGGTAPVTVELIPARGDKPAVTATFNPQPSPLSLRFARRAVFAIRRDGQPNGLERAADAFSAELVRHNLLAWTGIDVDGVAVDPTPDIERHDEGGKLVELVPGTISAFIAEPRLMEAADREYVMPWSERDAEKNGCAPLPRGTSAGATPAAGTASSSAKSTGKGGAGTSKQARRSAPTSATSPEPIAAKPSGS